MNERTTGWLAGRLIDYWQTDSQTEKEPDQKDF